MKLTYLVALTLSIVFVSCSSRMKTKSNAVEKKQLKVLAFNIQHGAPQGSTIINLENIASSIRASQADIIALQEVDINTARSGNVDQAKVLADILGMHYFFSKSIDYQGGDYGVAIISKYPILEKKRIELPNDFPKGEKRSVAYVTVEMPDKTKLDFASVHLDLVLNNRMQQMQVLNTIGNEASNPLIIAGDFNAQPQTEEMELLKESFTYPCDESCPLTFPANGPNRTIDYIVSNTKATQKFTSTDYLALTEEKTSDHLPLLGIYTY